MAMDVNSAVVCDHTGVDLTSVPVRIAAAVEYVPPRPGTQPPTLHFDSWASLRDYAAARAFRDLRDEYESPQPLVRLLDAPTPAPGTEEAGN